MLIKMELLASRKTYLHIGNYRLFKNYDLIVLCVHARLVTVYCILAVTQCINISVQPYALQ
jgi:hypothetical protein